jgi:hypothetical protein
MIVGDWLEKYKNATARLLTRGLLTRLTYSGFQMRATQLVRLRPRRQSLAGGSR